MMVAAAPLGVILADDHNLVRSGLVALLQEIPGVSVLAQAADGDELLALVAQHQPDVVITDISMRRMSGLEALARIRETHPDTRVLVLSMYANPEFVEQALRAGAAGYILKDAATVELELALEAVRRGDRYLSPQISTQVIERLLTGDGARAGEAANGLTPRQTEILARIARGQSTKEIAFDLGLSVKTVETHRATIMERLGIRDVPGLVRYAVKCGLVRLDP